MNYTERLKEASDRFDSIVCLGLDPVVEDIPEKGEPAECILRFYENILDKIVQKKVFPGSVKPNYAFYAQYGLKSIETLEKIVGLYAREGIPVILDVKRGDIGKTAQAYAREAYEYFKADAVTLSPYLGYDSIGPFVEEYPDKGSYILTKTSNKSSGEIQDVSYNGAPFYEYMAAMILKWHHPGMGSVVGATYPEQLDAISSIFIASGKEVPLLIPGVGTQGGSLAEVLRSLKKFPDMRIHRINSSSAINYAYKKNPGIHYADAAVEALKQLNEEIGSM
ncbi:MAG: orotidine-5'-phosphate decarboxylase [Spirochaetae bacterium HGW-Spirochaetae-1]|jgi:orotidine-5'-phosphate decarboxylase|nr:MAG: orotidine-5'-phosphate decarboxylase [Spirochaetae bacterium HGW-Spirochaetae-1]